MIKEYFLNLRKKEGFTKIDLVVSLVILGFIGVMAAPMMSDLIKKHDKELICQRNLREIGMSLIIYSRDNNGYFPASNGECARNLNSLYPDRFSELEKLKCPSSDFYRAFLNGKLKLDNSGSNDDVPVMCDDKEDNHRHGGNVLYADGSVICVAKENWKDGKPPEYSAGLENMLDKKLEF